MDFITQPTETQTNVTTVLDSNTVNDLLPSNEDVESEDSKSIEKNENDDLQQKTRTEENEIETRNIQLPDVDKVDKIPHDDDEQMDMRSADDHVNDFKSNIEAEQVEVAAKPQTEPTPQNEENEEYSLTDEDSDDERIFIPTKRCKYEKPQETEEDLLKSDHENDNNENEKSQETVEDLLNTDHEDDNNETVNEKSSSNNNITLEQEEELLKSDDEEPDEQEENEKTECVKGQNMAIPLVKEVNCYKEKSNDVQKEFENGSKEMMKSITRNLKTVSDDMQESKVYKKKHYKSELGKENSNFEDFKFEKNDEPFDCKQEHCAQANHSEESEEKKISQAKTKTNAENHRILYQFDLDDDSSSQESFQVKNSPELLNKSEPKEDNFQESPQECFYETTEFKNLVAHEDGHGEISHDMTRETTGDTEVHSPQTPLLESDEAVSDSDADVRSILSPKVTPARKEEASCDGEVKQDQFPSPHCSPKSDSSICDEDISLNQDCKVNETNENCGKLSDSWNCNEKKQFIFLHDSLSNNDKGNYNQKTFQNLNENEDSVHKYELNGGHNLETVQSEDSNDSSLKNTEESKASLSPKSSVDHNSVFSTPQQQSSSYIPQDETSQSSFHKDLHEQNSGCPQESKANDDNENQMEIGSDNENDFKINEKHHESNNENSKENEYKNKSSFSLSQTLKSPNEEDEASRSSLASSASYFSDTSSSQQLVIDHPMDDIKEDKVKPLKINLKRKLSYSTDDDASMVSQQKRFLFNEENQMQDNTQTYRFNEEATKKQPEFSPEHRSEDECKELTANDGKRYQNHQSDEESAQEIIHSNLRSTEEKISAESTSIKSLLLQQLERPLATPNMPPSYATASTSLATALLPLPTQATLLPSDPPISPSAQIFNPTELPLPTQPVIISENVSTSSQLSSFIPMKQDLPITDLLSLQHFPNPPPPPQSLILTSLPSPTQRAATIQALPIQPPPPPFTGVTKYLCFKCKTGSFDSFAALTEHQATCLASHNLFPFNTMPVQATLFTQTLVAPPIYSPRNSNVLPSIKPVVIPEQKEINTPPSQSEALYTKKRYYKCSSCNTFHENWNLFFHIREKHNRHICLYCIRFFPTAEKLALHLEIKHDLEQNHFNSEEALRNSIPMLEGHASESRFLMCCTCQHIFLENELFSQHDCSELIKPCTLCGQKGRHTNQCKAHPDSKRFSKLKKKKEKQMEPLTASMSAQSTNERNHKDLTVSPITISNHYINPTIISNSNLNCDSVHAEKQQRPPTFNAMHNEDSNSSSNMVIDESCNISHLPPAQTKTQETLNSDVSLGTQAQKSSERLEPDLPPDRQFSEIMEDAPLPPLKLVVPKLKLRVPKEFQKSVDDALSTSDSEEEVGDDDEEGGIPHEVHKEKMEKLKDSAPTFTTACDTHQTKESAAEATQNSLLAESTPANSQDMEMERNSTTQSATEAGNSQDVADESNSQKPLLLQDDDDSLDEPNSNLVRIMQEIERTKLDIQRTKKTSVRHSKTFALPRQPTISQSSNRTTDHNWSPTPPASPNSRWFTPRRSTLSQLQKTPQHQQSLLPPISPIKQFGLMQKRRDTVGSDMMDIDETITSQPTQTIYRSQLRPLDNDNFSTSIESIDDKSLNEPMDASQITDNETSVADLNNSIDENDKSDKLSQENKLNTEDLPPKQENFTQTADKMNISLTQSTDNENEEQTEYNKTQENETEDTEIDVCDNKEQEEQIQVTDVEAPLEEKLPPADGIEVANDDVVIVDMKLDKPLDKYQVIDFVRICLKTVYPLCLYCNHARRIAVNGKSLVLHMIGHHRFTATVDSITAEELLPATIVTKLKSFLPEVEEHYFNSTSYCTYGDGAFTSHYNERIFECFQCRFVASTHKELYLHNRKMHLRTAILCFMCRANFFSFSEILCHICPGIPNKVSVFDVKFRCCLCELDNIPSPFRLMVHLRKKHFACDVCLEDCRDQSKLSSHVWKHKLHHLCYRCGIAYRNKLDITKHLFWKHGTESTLCKRCLQKRWRHVYHFCIPPTTFMCEVCNLCFSKAMYLRVHKRLHSGDLRYPCIEDNCEEKFISRKLLLKHALVHQVLTPEEEKEAKKEQDSSTVEENKDNKSITAKDQNEENVKKSEELKIKQEIKDIKKEPFDEAEIENQSRQKSQLAEKKEKNEQKDCKNEEIKDKKRLASNETRKKRKKSKRSKELLEDLNLAAPNLSESDSSDGSDTDSDTKTKNELDALPRVMLSPPSEAENEEKEDKSKELVEPGQVLEIWKNFLKTQQNTSSAEELERLKADNEESKPPKRVPVHVAFSDHDYCKIEPDPPEPPTPSASEASVKASKDEFKKPAAEKKTTPETSPTKRKQNKSSRRLSSKRSDGTTSSSDSNSSSDSSCSCGSNCSCSSSGSNSSSSSSSSEDSDSSMASNNSLRKRHRKKSERDRMRKRSESMSPLKQHKLSVSISEIIQVDDEGNVKESENLSERPPSSPKEPLINESDLETNESETDEEFYDEHPQKLANELLAQKRAQLMAQTRLSPSHNYDIVENSRPSTPSLPEEVATNEKPKIKVKKKKRDRKSSCKGQGLHNAHVAAPEQAIAPAQIGLDVHQLNNSMMQVAPQQPSSLVATPFNTLLPYNIPTNIMTQTIYAPPPPIVFSEQTSLTPRPLTMLPYGSSHRMSEGSSCSDADGSLKRSKRQRRPNKFYGYTSDDENLINGPPLMIGTRAFKPQPPPQLTWCKDDLPTPSKSILNNKNKTPRTPKTPATSDNPFASTFSAPSSKKKSKLSLTGGDKSARKKPSKKKDSKMENNFPPIPTLKIRPSQIGLNTTINHSLSPNDGNYNTTDDTSSDEETTKKHFAPTASFNNTAVKQAIAPVALPPIVLPSQPPAPPTPQTTAFNHRIPPALLPNPDFATLQYFKANNIRYPIRPPAGARQPREGESVYCYCRCPYDEVSEMIACDGENCLIEWFHFECVGIMVAPQGKWFCAECRPKYSEELYPSTAAGQLSSV